MTSETCALQPTQLSQLVVGCVCILRINVVNSIIKCPFPSIPFSSWTLKEKTNKDG